MTSSASILIGRLRYCRAWVSIRKFAESGVRVIVSVFYCPETCNCPYIAVAYNRYLVKHAEKHLHGLRATHTAAKIMYFYH